MGLRLAEGRTVSIDDDRVNEASKKVVRGSSFMTEPAVEATMTNFNGFVLT